MSHYYYNFWLFFLFSWNIFGFSIIFSYLASNGSLKRKASIDEMKIGLMTMMFLLWQSESLWLRHQSSKWWWGCSHNRSFLYDTALHFSYSMKQAQNIGLTSSCCVLLTVWGWKGELHCTLSTWEAQFKFNCIFVESACGYENST